jgi:adenylate cyclase, class 2
MVGVGRRRKFLGRHYTEPVMRAGQTKLEVEIKLPISEPRQIIDRLLRLGARQHDRVLERNTLYDTPESDFRCRGCLLRLRAEKPTKGAVRALITAKAPPPERTRNAEPSRYKERLEREASVADPARAKRLLSSVGLRPSFRYEKYRTAFDLLGLHIALDETPVGAFLELEGRPAAIDRVARRLGFSPSDYLRATYWDLYAADCRRRGREPRNMLFPRQNSRKP